MFKYLMAFVLLCVAGCQFHFELTSDPLKSSNPAHLAGVLIAIGDVWTMNGDGGVLLLYGKKQISVSVRGACQEKPETKIVFAPGSKSKYIQDLKDKMVVVIGVMQPILNTKGVVVDHRLEADEIIESW